MHPLAASGATFKAGQETFVTIPRPTDMDVDGSGQIFISSWRDGGFTYSKPNVGYVIRVAPTGAKAKAFPDLLRADPAAMVRAISADSSVLRLAAQRALLRRGADVETTRGLETLAKSASVEKPGRVAAVFTLAQALGAQADDFLISLAQTDPDLREAAIRALADRRDRSANAAKVTQVVGSFLRDANPRVRVAAVVASGRMPMQASAPTLLALTADTDPIVAHTAVQALVKLNATAACLAALTDPGLAPGATRALQAMHDPPTVAGLIAVAEQSRDDAARKQALRALCRLYFTEAPYEQGQWWGTRPDTTGPYYKAVTWASSSTIAQALQGAMKQADPVTARWLLNEMIKHKLDFEESTRVAMKLASSDREIRASVVTLMVSRPKLQPDAIEFLTGTMADPSTDSSLRLKVIRGLLRHQNQAEARAAIVGVLTAAGVEDNPSDDFVGAWTEYVKDNRHLRDLAPFVKLANDADPGRSTLGYAVLVSAVTNDKAPEAAKATAAPAVQQGWSNPSSIPHLLRAVGLAKANSLAAQVQPLLTDERTEIRQAAEFAAKRLNLTRSSDAKVTAPAKTKASKPIAATPYEVVLAAALADPGDVSLGTQLFERQGCVNCHAIAKSGPIKGPYLGDVAARYNRSELIESILKPSARIAQGFETQKIATTNGQTIEGFVVREAGDEVELRNSAGNVVVVAKKEIEERGKAELSVMPQGLLDPLTPHDLASLLAYLESIKGK